MKDWNDVQSPCRIKFYYYSRKSKGRGKRAGVLIGIYKDQAYVLLDNGRREAVPHDFSRIVNPEFEEIIETVSDSAVKLDTNSDVSGSSYYTEEVKNDSKVETGSIETVSDSGVETVSLTTSNDFNEDNSNNDLNDNNNERNRFNSKRVQSKNSEITNSSNSISTDFYEFPSFSGDVTNREDFVNYSHKIKSYIRKIKPTWDTRSIGYIQLMNLINKKYDEDSPLEFIFSCQPRWINPNSRLF